MPEGIVVVDDRVPGSALRLPPMRVPVRLVRGSGRGPADRTPTLEVLRAHREAAMAPDLVGAVRLAMAGSP